MAETLSNTPEFTVSELAYSIRRAIEDGFGHVRVRGEISGYRGPHSSGHAYFALKDEGAKIEAVVWRATMAKLKFRPEEGLEVIATGRITTFPGGSKYQIVIEALEPAGAGALMALLEERRRKLAAEGLFDPARKVPLPYLPRVVGVVTSPTGAVIRDILHRLADRFPTRVVVWPVRVQGETSAREVAAAIQGFDAIPPEGHRGIPRPDVLIVARGGGSLEDLWSFNEEIVVRAAAACRIPLVSAVGHETDWTLIDHVADLRAPTPTGAAEMVVPVRADLVERVSSLGHRLTRTTWRCLEARRTELRSAARALGSPEAFLAARRQRLDIAAGRLSRALGEATRASATRYARVSGRLTPETLTRAIRLGAERLDRLAGRGARAHAVAQERRTAALARLSGLLSPETLTRTIRLGVERIDLLSGRGARAHAVAQERRIAALARLAGRLSPQALTARVERCGERTDVLGRRLDGAAGLILERKRARLDGLARLIGSLSYRAVLERGFALVRDGAGRPIRRAAAIAAGASLSLEFADGRRAATADAGPPAAGPDAAAPPAAPELRPARPRRRDAAPAGGQGTLF